MRAYATMRKGSFIKQLLYMDRNKAVYKYGIVLEIYFEGSQLMVKVLWPYPSSPKKIEFISIKKLELVSE